MHLMVELKHDELGVVADRAERLGKIFATLTAGEDYHFLALQLDLFALVEFADYKARLPVAELGLKVFSEAALTQDLGGFCGQYLLLNQPFLFLSRTESWRRLDFYQSRARARGRSTGVVAAMTGTRVAVKSKNRCNSTIFMSVFRSIITGSTRG
jgi:hypothetical protein